MVGNAWSLLLALTLAAVLFSGCTSPGRDIESEAKDREAWAKEHNTFDPVAILTGPKTIAPGALVWYSAYGSHDPDFFGAKNDDDRREARNEAGVHYEDDAYDVGYHWYVGMDDATLNRGLGPGIKEYRWRVDDGPVLVAHELTHRYGSDDGPVRFPVGFADPGMHRLTLKVVDWSGSSDAVTAEFEVQGGGTASTVDGWSATPEGWRYERDVEVSWQQYGECPIGFNQYDPVVHRMSVPWDLVFYMADVRVEATWEPERDPADLLAINLNDVDLTLGHCGNSEVWTRFAADTEIGGDELVEGGSVDGVSFAQHVEILGAKTERSAEWDFNAYLSDEGDTQWGKGTTARVAFVFEPATDTSYGGQ